VRRDSNGQTQLDVILAAGSMLAAGSTGEGVDGYSGGSDGGNSVVQPLSNGLSADITVGSFQQQPKLARGSADSVSSDASRNTDPAVEGDQCAIVQYHGHVEDLKKFGCSHCDYRSTRKGDVKKHIVTHSKNKPFHCRVAAECTGGKKCTKAFRDPSTRTRHEKIHTRDPLQCTQCNMAFVVHAAFEKHVQEAHLQPMALPDAVQLNLLSDHDFERSVFFDQSILNQIIEAPATQQLAPKFHAAASGIPVDMFLDELLAQVSPFEKVPSNAGTGGGAPCF
jgi:uncharacterized C2H2 Zn-finger protein